MTSLAAVQRAATGAVTRARSIRRPQPRRKAPRRQSQNVKARARARGRGCGRGSGPADPSSERRTPQPIVRQHLLADRLFASSTAVMFTGIMAFLGSLFLMALFLQDGLGLSALNAELSTFPEALGVMAGSQIAGRVYPRIGPRRMLTAGMAGFAAITALMVTVGPGTSLWWVRALMLLLGLS